MSSIIYPYVRNMVIYKNNVITNLNELKNQFNKLYLYKHRSCYCQSSAPL